MSIVRLLLSALLLFAFTGCTLKVQKVPPIAKLDDSSGFWEHIDADICGDKQFLYALDRSLSYYLRTPSKTFEYGGDKFTGSAVGESLLQLKLKCAQNHDNASMIEWLKERFDVYESKNKSGSSLFTGYYAPTLNGSYEKSERFCVPLYGVPSDMVTANLSLFIKNQNLPQIVGRVENGELLPYYTREQIAKGALASQKPIIYVEDPLEAFYLEIQGSGIVKLENNESIYVLYAGRNGHKYNSIGRLMLQKGLLSENNVSMQSIKEYINANQKSKEEILNLNPSYVFFKTGPGPIVGNIGEALTAFKSIAMDSRAIPKGSLAFVRTKLPTNEQFESFVFVQDTGGAIKGGGRVDLYMGETPLAAELAGRMKAKGEVFLLSPKR